MRNILLSALIILMAGCTTAPVAPRNFEEVVFQLQTDYNAAVVIETLYDNLPDCDETTAILCSEDSVVIAVRQYDEAAWLSIQQAKVAVQLNGMMFSGSVPDAVAKAKADLKNFSEVVKPLKVE